MHGKSDGALYLTTAQATRADINMLRLAIDNSLNTLYVRFPHTVGAPVGVADLDAESHTFSANITFCHRNQLLPAVSKQLDYDNRNFVRLQALFEFF